jgi:hypothetical protein
MPSVWRLLKPDSRLLPRVFPASPRLKLYAFGQFIGCYLLPLIGRASHSRAPSPLPVISCGAAATSMNQKHAASGSPG